MLVGLAVGILAWEWRAGSARRLDQARTGFLEDAGQLLPALQQYKEFTGRYPEGQNLDVARALSGHGPDKVVILTVRGMERNAKGELVDPWGTPVAFYISADPVLVRSAGPNKVWEDSASRGCDDLFCSN